MTTPIKPGTLYLFPTPLGKTKENVCIPKHVLKKLHTVTCFCVENLQNAVSFLKWAEHPVPDFKLQFYELNKRTAETTLNDYIQEILSGKDMGILTDAGCPAVADPGADLVKLAHHFDIEVVPFTGPSSPLLALMGSGLGGQKFAFNGYLPVKTQARENAIKELEQRSAETGSSELFMETPFRNMDTLKSLLNTLENDTLLTITANLTLDGEYIKTREVSDWKHRKMPDIDKQPAIFGIKAKENKPPLELLRRKAVRKKFSR